MHDVQSWHLRTVTTREPASGQSMCRAGKTWMTQSRLAEGSEKVPRKCLRVATELNMVQGPEFKNQHLWFESQNPVSKSKARSKCLLVQGAASSPKGAEGLRLARCCVRSTASGIRLLPTDLSSAPSNLCTLKHIPFNIWVPVSSSRKWMK